ncbi:vWA domain-containing protein [Methyloceanibacter caenitepidi]|uniref:von Willebrand factor type A domain protein n=1 Tax=Methyloceanibacter caenitepidi TaxID=1384459 RepID=A0A0A8K3J1_9HYPH|nr:VWA domain-containing protein [Methyloceanibacter caenitepidi]BAQ16564.1 Von Willebrand factor type A domain protein [Methyloceanibacter caenitepidi]
MSDKFDQLKDALQGEPPAPDPQARQAALNLAMARFAEKHAARSQGTAPGRRHTSSGGMGPSAIWSAIVTALKPSNRNWTPVLAGGASLAVLTLAVLSTHSLRPDLLDWRETATEPKLAKREAAPTPAKPDRDAVANRDTSTAQEHPMKMATGQPTPAAPVGQDDEAAMAPAPEMQALPAPGMQGAPVTDARSGFFAGRSQMAAPGSGYAVPAARLRQMDIPAPDYFEQGRDRFEAFDPNPVKVVKEDPVSTFSIDVDTASYAYMRSRLNQGVLPAPDSIRVEELVNYFPYDYAGPDSAAVPFKTNVSLMPTPWNADTKLMRIGIKGYELAAAQQPRANLVFLIDTSGSMQAQNKLPLLRNAFKLLLTSLDPDDTVSIVTYAGSAGTALEPTKVSDTPKILAALETLSAGGSTAGGEGIRQAYALAEANKVDGINRVILATDGDFNVGISDKETLKDFVAREREKGVSLSVLGFGAGNYNDALMQALAQNGNGNASYIDTLNEARKVLVDDAAGTLQTIAKDVKIQVEFNPAAVSEYRLIGYETRKLNREDFNNDKVDAGEIGAGHTVTALYEIVPAGSSGRFVEDLRYRSNEAETSPASKNSDELAFVKIRYKQPDGDKSELISTPVTTADAVPSTSAADTDARFAAAVAGFGQVLKGGRYTGDWSIDDAIALAEGARGKDPFGYRAEFLNLARLAKTAAALEPLKQR